MTSAGQFLPSLGAFLWNRIHWHLRSHFGGLGHCQLRRELGRRAWSLQCWNQISWEISQFLNPSDLAKRCWSLRITHSQNHQIHQILHLESSQTLINLVFIRASTIFHPLSFWLLGRILQQIQQAILACASSCRLRSWVKTITPQTRQESPTTNHHQPTTNHQPTSSWLTSWFLFFSIPSIGNVPSSPPCSGEVVQQDHWVSSPLGHKPPAPRFQPWSKILLFFPATKLSNRIFQAERRHQSQPW